MRLLITRPLEDGLKLKVRLEALGHICELLPLIDIQPIAGAVFPQRNYQAICFTSANGIRSVPWTDQQKTIRVLTVGPQSRDEALRQGFTTVEALGGDVDAMLREIVKILPTKAGPILYPSGVETSGDLEGKLKIFGYEVDRVKVYDATPATQIPNSIDVSKCEGVLLYSARTATIWASLNERPLPCFCLSQNVAEKLPQIWPKHVASEPTDKSMLELLERFGKAE